MKSDNAPERGTMRHNDLADQPQVYGDVPYCLRPDPWAKRLRTLKVFALLLGTMAAIAGLCVLLTGGPK